MKRSAVFKALLAADMKERKSSRIELKNVKLATGRELLYYLYNGRMKERQEESDLLGLIALADQYDMAELKTLCAERLADRLTNHNCLAVLSLAQLHNIPPLKTAAMDYMSLRMLAAWPRKRPQVRIRENLSSGHVQFIVFIT